MPILVDESSPTDKAKIDLLKILVVCEHASAQFGGEAILPLHWFKQLREAGDSVWLISHERTRDELIKLYPDCTDSLYFTEDTRWQMLLHRLRSRPLPRIFDILLDHGIHIATQIQQRKLARALVQQHAIDVVLEPMPVSPRQPSLMFDLGAPVVIGPMNGGMSYPPGFRSEEGWVDRFFIPVARAISALTHFLLPGKRRARLLLVANERTRTALPWSIRRTPAHTLVENGIDPSRWLSEATATTNKTEEYSFAFVGRLVDWKAVDILLGAFSELDCTEEATLHIYGDGPSRETLELQAEASPQASRIHFHGFVPQDQLPTLLSRHECLVLPSLYECGGAVVLEAMALGLPVIATNWGGPMDYLDDSCGILVDPGNRNTFQVSLRNAMKSLADNRCKSRAMGAAGMKKVFGGFAWPNKAAQLRALLKYCLANKQGSGTGSSS